MSFPLGLYLHIPFCESKCDYCNFASGVYPELMVLPYLEALREEILSVKGLFGEVGASAALLAQAEVDTIYFGGGTPSLIDAAHIAGLMRLLNEVFTIAPDVEVTLEANPGSVNFVKTRQHREAGVNRISIGMQTFQDELLKRIGRSHSVADSVTTLSLYRDAGIANVSLDLIAGLPGQTLANWTQNLREVEALAPDHISMYMLEIHENTRFGKIYGKPNKASLGAAVSASRDNSSIEYSDVGSVEEASPVELPEDDLVVGFYTQAVRRFAELGYQQYEISNFARPGRRSRHNLKYWTGQPFIGFGCGAYSYFDGKRWGNERSVGRYVELIQRCQHAIDYRSDLSPIDQQEEAIFLGLRLTEGIGLTGFQSKFGFDLREKYRKQIAHLQDAGLIESTPQNLRLTSQGWILSNEVFTEFLR